VRRRSVILLLALLCPATAGLAEPYTSTVRTAILDLEEYLQKAQAAQGPLCDPETLARAQTCLASAKEEFREGDYWEAEDILDACRKNAEGIWDRILACGMDRDVDGVPDLFDRCPDDPETYNGYLDDDGCPDRLPERAVLSLDRIEIIEPLRFDDETQQLMSPSSQVLQDVARILHENPAIRIRVQAYWDDSIPPERAREITDARADTVRDELAGMGVPAHRIESVGMGSLDPVASNDSPVGRRMNQRVEFLRQP